MEIFTTIQTTTYYLGTCETCNRPYRVDLGSRRLQYQTIDCPGCSKPLQVERLAAVTTEEVCDPRCMGATGPNCSCACGGANHGAAWGTMATTYELESAIKALRARQERLERQRKQRAEAKATAKRSAFERWAEAGNSDVVDYLTGLDPFELGSFLFDMVSLVSEQKPLTDNQANAVRRIARQEAGRKVKQDAYEATKKAAPLGKGLTVAGTIISVKGEQDRYSYYDKTVWKMTVECNGYRVYGTVPSILVRNPIKPEQFEALKGQKVRFTATIEPTKRNDDPSFAIFKRPTKAELVK